METPSPDNAESSDRVVFDHFVLNIPSVMAYDVGQLSRVVVPKPPGHEASRPAENPKAVSSDIEGASGHPALNSPRAKTYMVEELSYTVARHTRKSPSPDLRAAGSAPSPVPLAAPSAPSPVPR
eukprot:scpid108021/ scgid35320/ 